MLEVCRETRLEAEDRVDQDAVYSDAAPSRNTVSEEETRLGAGGR